MKEENDNIEKVEDKVDNIIKKAKASGKMTIPLKKRIKRKRLCLHWI